MFPLLQNPRGKRKIEDHSYSNGECLMIKAVSIYKWPVFDWLLLKLNHIFWESSKCANLMTFLLRQRSSCSTFREFTQRRRQRQRQRQRQKEQDKQNNILHVHHAFLYISLPSLHDYSMKLPNFMFRRGREQKTTTFSLFFSWTLMQSFRIQLQKNLPRIDKLNKME